MKLSCTTVSIVSYYPVGQLWVKNSEYLLITDAFKTEEASFQNASSVHLVGQVGLEPTNNGVRVRCLTTWLRPNMMAGAGRLEHPTDGLGE